MQQKYVLRVSAAAVFLAIAIRLLGVGMWKPVWTVLSSEKILSFLIYTQTGRICRSAGTQTEATLSTQPPNYTIPTQITQQQPTQTTTVDAVVSFSGEDAALVQINNQTNYDPDPEALLLSGETVDLTGADPTVLIIHTHGSESYTGDYEPVEDYRSLDESENMLAVGAELTRLLQAGGVCVIHDRGIYDYPDYNSAYSDTRKVIEDYLEQYPTITMVLDLHRDAAQTVTGQLVTTATVGGQQSAQLMMVVGTDAGGNHHPCWQENLALALKLSVILEQENPGICRPISLRTQRFNMDLTSGSLLIEVGAAGNTLQEALTAVRALADAILLLGT